MARRRPRRRAARGHRRPPVLPRPAQRSRAWREDLALAQALGADGRATYAQLAARTGLPPTTLRRRLADLRDSGRLVLRCDASPHSPATHSGRCCGWTRPDTNCPQ
ncbi:AsnC family transcriptional regulator [Streptacidiphilus monticola]